MASSCLLQTYIGSLQHCSSYPFLLGVSDDSIQNLIFYIHHVIIPVPRFVCITGLQGCCLSVLTCSGALHSFSWSLTPVTLNFCGCCASMFFLSFVLVASSWTFNSTGETSYGRSHLTLVVCIYCQCQSARSQRLFVTERGARY